jgi:LysM repeat protein
MRKEYDALVDDRDRMAAQAHSLEAREQELTRQLEAAASQATAASAESQSLRQKEEALSGELAEIRRRLEEVNADRNELARARAEGAERIAELESELAAQTRRVQEVSQEVETLRRTKMDLEAQGEKVRTETTTLRQQIEANARAAEELEHQLASRDEEMLALRVRFQQEAERLRSRAEEQKRHINHRLVKFRRLAASFGVAFAASLMVIFSIAKNDYPGNRALTVNAASGQEASQDRRLPEMGADKVVTPGASREEPAPGAPSGTAQTPSVEDKPAAASPVDGLPPISLFRKPEGAPASAAEATVVEKAEPSSRPPDRAAQARDKAAATDAKTAQSKKSDKAPVVVLHAVQKGETLRSICAKHGINTQKGVEAVSRMNSIADPDKIRVGQVLRIAKNETI